MLGALDAFSSTFGLLIVFVVAFPALVPVLIGFVFAQVLGERRQNQNYKKRAGGTSSS